jgi:hypothetical protein
MSRRLRILVLIVFVSNLASIAQAYVVVGGGPPQPPDVRPIQPR